MNYLELYPGDYLRDTKHLPLVEHGAYLLLLMAYYSTEKPLPADVASLYRIAGAMSPAEQKAVRSVADQFFPVAADGLRHNARADAEIAKAQKRIVTARDNGRKGGRPPKHEPNENPPGFDLETHREPVGKAPHTPHAIHQQEAGTPDTPVARAPARGHGTEAGRACALMRQAGCPLQQLNPSHPDLLAALDLGVTPEVLADTVREAIASSKARPFTWAIATARGRLEESRNPSTRTHGATAHAAARPSATDRVLEAIQRGRERDRDRDDAIDAEAVRVPR
jgi:uncharacterized protein YdaU (DUF1376 family)